jgi:tetratricopeptide (TPR) repeat protein
MWTAVAVLACGLGMGSKEAMATAPVAVLLFDRVFVFASFRQAFRARWRLYAGLACSWLILAGLMATRPRPFSAGFSAGVSVWTYALNQPAIIIRYLGQTLWPTALVANYGWPVPLQLRDALPCAIFIGTLVLLTMAALRWRPWLGFLGAWFFLTLAPASSIVPIATEVGAERRMYLPLASLMVLGVVGLTLWWDALRVRRPHLIAHARTASIAGAALLGAVSTTLALTTAARNREYRSGVVLAQSTIDRYPTPSAHHTLAEYLLKEGRREEAMAHLRQAVPGAPRAHYTLGVELYKEGRLDEAIVELRAFIEKQPRLVHVIEAHGYLGKAFTAREEWAAAAEEFRAILRITPDNPVADHSLADVLFAAGRYQEAVPHYETYLSERPDDVDALNRLGVSFGSLDRFREAASALLRAERVDPRSAEVQHNLATALWNLDDFDAALERARRAVLLQPDNPGSQNLLREMLEGRP